MKKIQVDIYADYPLTDLEKDIRPEDFKETSIYHKLVKHCGPASVVILAEYFENVGRQLTLRDKSSVTRNAYKRQIMRNNHRNN